MSFLFDHAAIISLLFFFVVFVFIAINAYRPRMKQVLQEHAQIPLREEE